MPKDETEGLRFLFRTGLLMLGGYTSLGSRDKLYHHDQCFVPLWVRPILQEIFKELSEVPEDIEKELERIEEERKVRDVCPICNRKVFYREKWTKVFGRVFHASCFKNRTGLLRPADERSLGEMFKKLEIISGEYLWEVPVGEETGINKQSVESLLLILLFFRLKEESFNHAELENYWELT